MAGARDLHTVDQIVEMMRANIATFVFDVWQLRRSDLRGYDEHGEWVCLNPLRASDNSPGSFRIPLRGPKQGMVIDHAGHGWIPGHGSAVSPLTFHAHLMFGGQAKPAIEDVKARLGLAGTDPAALRQARERHARFVERQINAAEEQAKADEKNRQSAWKRYAEAEKDIRGTPVETYLGCRGIEIGRLDFPLRALRYHPNLWCRELGPRDDPAASLPAMVAPVVNAKGRFLGLHRTWLTVCPGGQVIKALQVTENKKTLGRYGGGVIRLWNGIVADPEAGEIGYGPSLGRVKGPVEWHLTEGIEDGLAVAVAIPQARIVAGIAIGNYRRIAQNLPEAVKGVNIWRQNDAPDSPAARDFARAVDVFQEAGIRVRIVRLPDEWKDPAEVLQKSAQGALDERGTG